MIIICKHCQAKYMVTSSSLGTQGRSVKCAKCQNTWFAKPETEENSKAEKVILGSNSRLKSENFRLPVISKKRIPLFLKMLPGFLILLIIITSTVFFPEFVTKIPGCQDLYIKLGAFSTEGLSFQDIAIRKITTISGKNLVIRGQIHNKSYQDKKIPYIKLFFYTKDGLVLKIINAPPKFGLIKAGENYELNYTISPLSERAEFIRLDLGNSYELFLR